MANMVRVNLKAEADVKIQAGEFKVEDIDNSSIAVYVGCDEINCWVGTVSSVSQLIDLVGPDSLVETIKENCSEYEYDCLESALWSRDYNYMFINRLEKAVNE